MAIRIQFDSSGIHDLAHDCEQIGATSYRHASRIVKHAADDGNTRAKGFARESAGSHGKHYHRAFTVEQIGVATHEYGPDSAMPQGGMSFEFGSRNQPPHLDLAKSADLIGPQLAKEMQNYLRRAFW